MNKTILLPAFSFFQIAILVSSVFGTGVSAFGQTGRLVLNSNPSIVFNPTATAYIVITNSNADAITCRPSLDCTTSGRIITGGENNKIKWFAQTTLGTYIIPYFYAASSTMIPFVFNKTTAGTEAGAGTGNFIASTWYTLDNAAWPSGGSNLCGIATENDVIDRFWVIDVPGYTAGGPPTATMRLSYTPTDIAGVPVEADLLAQRWNSAMVPACKWETPPLGTWSSGYVQVTTSAFSPWTLTNKNKPLPIELMSFTGECYGKNILLRWSTASEISNSLFTIERSADGDFFESIGTIPGAGNSSGISKYEFSDSELPPAATILYYRLKQTDFDGLSSYSPAKAVQLCNGNKATILESVYGLGNGKIAIVIQSGEEKNFNIAFYDATGKKIMEEKISVEKGKSVYPLSSASFATGVYLVRMYNESENITYKTFLK